MIGRFKTEAFIVKKTNLLGKDLVITLFSKDQGKIKIFAKGIKKITSRRLSHIETGNLIEALIYVKNERFYLQESKLISLFSQTKKNKDKLKQLYLILFVLDRTLPENQREEGIYNELLRFIVALAKEKIPDEQLLLTYLNKFLKLLGYSKEAMSFAKALVIIEEIISEKVPEFVI